MFYGKEGPDKVDGVRDIIATWLVYGVVLLGLVLLSEIRAPSEGQEPTAAATPPIAEYVAERDLAAERPKPPKASLLTQRLRVVD